MTVTTLSRQEFSQDVGRAEQAADLGPVFITDQGRPAHVLLSIAEYRRLTHDDQTLFDAVAQVGVSDFEFSPAPSETIIRRPDLS